MSEQKEREITEKKLRIKPWYTWYKAKIIAASISLIFGGVFAVTIGFLANYPVLSNRWIILGVLALSLFMIAFTGFYYAVLNAVHKRLTRKITEFSFDGDFSTTVEPVVAQES